MESNRLLIGVQFIDKSGQNTVIELIVLRDSTLQQLFDGIRYGLLKKGKMSVYKTCSQIFDICIRERSREGEYKKITLTSHNESLGLPKNAQNRVILRQTDNGKTLTELGFISSTRIVFDCTEQYQSFEINTSGIVPAFNPDTKPDPEKRFPEYNISTRQLYVFDNTPVDIIPPSNPPQKQNQNLFFTMLPTVLMISVMILVRSMISQGGNGMTMIALSASMSGVTMLIAIINWLRQNYTYKKQLLEWRYHYEEYIKNTIADVKRRMMMDTQKLDSLYPDVNELLNRDNKESGIYSVCGDIFSRCSADKDFLTVRLGLSNEVESMFQIKGTEKDEVFSAASFEIVSGVVKIRLPEDKEYKPTTDRRYYLSNLPGYIANKNKYLTDAPLLFPFKNCGALGIVSQNEVFTEALIERMIFNLCFYHSPDDLQFVVFFKEQNDWDEIERCISIYKFLPHFRELFPDKSQFVFDSESANAILGALLNKMAERSENGSSKLPHIIFLIYEEYGLKEHAFAQYLPKMPEGDDPYENKIGLTFVFPKLYKEHLPAYCNDVITAEKSPDESKIAGSLVPHEDEKLRKDFTFTLCEDWKWHLYNSYKILSALSYSKISQNGKVPSNVSLFELFGLNKNNLDIGNFWVGVNGRRAYDVRESIGVPIGKTDSGMTYLDLHEKYDGPHMLVAGTTGSGKSETIISYLLGLCLCFRPDEVNMMLVDMKGGGFIKRIGELPHVVGSVTDVDGDENGTGAEYMLKRFLNALTSEIKRRKILFNSMHVDSINGYIAACRNIDSHVKSINNQLKGEGKPEMTPKEEQEIRDQAKYQPLAHLILVVDEFTELKRFTTENNDIDFIGEITTIARVGRSLGFHIILISQNIEGAITDDIRVNSKSRLCLKVATRQASKEMIGNDLAASPTMPGNGRAYILVGTGSKFEYFQSAYSGASVEDNIEAPIEIIEAKKNGPYTSFYRSEKDNKEQKEMKKKLEEQGMLKTQLNALVGAIQTYYNNHKSEYPEPHIVFQKPLPNRMYMRNGKIYEYRDGKYEFMREVREND
ncbi:MAG: hypothetical protein IKQ90_09625 [Ruminococcus sp.]|nr:hypothetical protein [Ruminococcus sp.]